MADDWFILDGYEKSASIPAVPGLHPALRVRYRPALFDERLDHLSARDVDGREGTERIARMVVRHLESWDAKVKGEVAPRTAEMVRKLQPALLERLLNLVLGYTPAEEAADAKNSLLG